MVLKKGNRCKRWCFALCALLLFVVSAFGVLQLGCLYTEKTWTHWRPDYEPIELSTILDKETLSEEDYGTLYKQTGLTKLAIDDMRTTQEGKVRILAIQKALFTDYTVKTKCFAIMVW